ncbi:MAG: DUF885 domain-containing protein [Lachnospiraceae bacterium]|nr:DUF885 domain-containing protein [Lachnospiraceae bacterium]
MKKTKHSLLPAVLTTLTILTLFSGCGSTDDHFADVGRALFAEEMSTDTLSLHYTLASPGKYGLATDQVSLPLYDKGASKRHNDTLTEYRDTLSAMTPEELSPENETLRKLLVSGLTDAIQVNSFSYYEEPFSPSSGVHTQLLILLAEYRLQHKQDVEEYLSLLEIVPDYLDSLLTYEQEKARAGLFMSIESLQEVLKGCESCLTEDSICAGEHFLQQTFSERLGSLQTTGDLSSKEAAAYIEKHTEILLNQMLPAYQALREGLWELREYCCPVEGLCHKPEGRAYYEALLKSQTGSGRSVEDIRSLLTRQIDEQYDALIYTLRNKNVQELLRETQGPLTTDFPLTQPMDILQDLQTRMEEDFPPLQTTVGLQVKNVSDALTEHTAPAFYLTPPLDDYKNNVIYINKKLTATGLELYTTLAHEGFPGHLYQTTYDSYHMEQQENGYLKSLLWYGGFLEGWALYTEFMAYDYATDLLEESGYEDAATIAQAEKYQRSLLLAVYGLLDIIIHYDGATEVEVYHQLEKYGITDKETVAAIYRYIVEEPTNYLKYYAGYLEILELKKQALTVWGDDYSDLSFHKFLLDNGPADFDTLLSILDIHKVPM